MMNHNGLINNFYSKYRDIIHFNKNFLIASIVTALLDVAIVTYASITYAGNNLLISIISLTADFAIFNLIFIILFYVENKQRYLKSDGTKDKQQLRQDSIKLVTTLGLSEIVYLFTKFVSTYLFFEFTQINSSEISIITTVIGWILYATTANIMIKKTKFFK
ncbi:hypothetical protein [Candidatus Nitrosocosmicus sp. R]